MSFVAINAAIVLIVFIGAMPRSEVHWNIWVSLVWGLWVALALCIVTIALSAVIGLAAAIVEAVRSQRA